MQYIGNIKKVNNSLEVAGEYEKIAERNLRAAKLLQENGMYNEAYYYYIQSMEKTIKGKICRIVDVTNPFFAEQMIQIGHSLDNAIEILIKIVSQKDKNMYEHIRTQIVEEVFKGISFSKLYNSVRYPMFLSKKKEYGILEISYEECIDVARIEKRMRTFLKELDRL